MAADAGVDERVPRQVGVVALALMIKRGEPVAGRDAELVLANA